MRGETWLFYFEDPTRDTLPIMRLYLWAPKRQGYLIAWYDYRTYQAAYEVGWRDGEPELSGDKQPIEDAWRRLRPWPKGGRPQGTQVLHGVPKYEVQAKAIAYLAEEYKVSEDTIAKKLGWRR